MFDTEQVIYGEFWVSVYQEALKLIAHSSMPLSLYKYVHARMRELWRGGNGKVIQLLYVAEVLPNNIPYG